VVEVWRPKPKARHHRIIFGGACSIDKGKGIVKGKILLPVAMSNA
jgi:hypothetical protein